MTRPWINNPIKSPSESMQQAARARQNRLTKPQGALGRLEDLVIQLAGLQNQEKPCVDPARIVVFAADHGIINSTPELSAYPQSVTEEMVKNFSSGGAAISVLAKHLDIQLELVDVGILNDPGPLPKLISQRIAPGTKDFRRGSAMTAQQCNHALKAGRDAVLRAKEAGVKLFIGGEMAIGNTTSASAITSTIASVPPEAVAGPGTGITEQGIAEKAQSIHDALSFHILNIRTPLDALSRLGGFEIAALTGAFIACGQEGIPALVDGYIATVAATLAVNLRASLKAWLIFSHHSAEPGHLTLLRALKETPLLDLNMRLGEASGAATAFPLLRLACALHAQMATFEDAGVSQA
ncbi:nicotinate-nucleotide--dimethylbenzimidazole phosphoribosyltransferase [Magnetococcales bacterium HHB-1]